MLPIFASVSVSLTPLPSPHSLSPAIAPSPLLPERPSPFQRLQGRHSPPTLPTSLQISLLPSIPPSLWPPEAFLSCDLRNPSLPLPPERTPTGIDQQRSLGTTCGIRIDNYMYIFIHYGDLYSASSRLLLGML